MAILPYKNVTTLPAQLPMPKGGIPFQPDTGLNENTPIEPGQYKNVTSLPAMSGRTTPPPAMNRRRGILPMGGMVRGFGMNPDWFRQGMQPNPNMRFMMPMMRQGFQAQPMNSIQPVANPNLVQMRGFGGY